ncbi:ROK family protein [Phreatobacter stygius]|nr:ROK family protein [Phreatobacter stygius]
MTGPAAIGIDIGGTAIKLGLVTGEGKVLARRRFAYAAMASFDHLAGMLVEAVGAMAAETSHDVAAIGIAAPGHARPGDGLMIDGTSNVPLLRDRSLAAALKDRLNRPVVTLNDGAAAAYGELHFGAGRGLERFVLMTFGTGVGGGVVIAGQVIRGNEGEPPEIGAMVLDAGARPGTFEAFASAAGFSAAYRDAGGPAEVPPEQIFARAAAGEATANLALDATCRRIAQACGTMINLLNLEACLLGGGIAAAGAPLRDRVASHLTDFAWPFLCERTTIAVAATGQDAGVLGAGAWALDRRLIA